MFVKLEIKRGEWYHTVSAGGARHMADIGCNRTVRISLVCQSFDLTQSHKTS